MASKNALITGITGQDGSYLAEFLLEKGYEVHGLVRRSSSFNRGRIEKLRENLEFPFKRIHLHYGDMTDSPSLNRLMYEVRPDEVYNLAAQSHVRISFDIPQFTAQTNALGVINILERNIEQKKDMINAGATTFWGKPMPSKKELLSELHSFGFS